MGQFKIKVTEKLNKKRELCRQMYILEYVKAVN